MNWQLVCAQPVASAVRCLCVATIRIGKCVSDRTAPTLSSAETVLREASEILRQRQRPPKRRRVGNVGPMTFSSLGYGR